MCGALAINAPSRIEQRAAEIQAFLDIDRIRGVLQAQSHLFGDVHENVVEQLQHDRIGMRTQPLLAGSPLERGAARCSRRQPRCASQPGSTTVVALRSARMAGPSIRAPGASPAHDIAALWRQPAGCAVRQTVHGDLGVRARARRAPPLVAAAAAGRIPHPARRIPPPPPRSPAPAPAPRIQTDADSCARIPRAPATRLRPRQLAAAARKAAPYRCPDSERERAPGA